jgi:multiple sugar transport system permease protein
MWLVPIGGAMFASLRPFSETIPEGVFSWPDTLTLDDYRNAWEQGNIGRK